MTAYIIVLIIIWLCFLVYWLVSAFSAKKSIHNGALWNSLWIRIAIIAVIFIALHFGLLSGPELKDFALNAYSPLRPYWAWGTLGDVIALTGLLLALWARTTLGRNWGMPMTLRANPELVTTGPYAYIRHPIYTALFLMIIGSVFVESSFWLIVLVIVFIYFYVSAKKEESDMAARFPDQYPAYKKGTKMMIPFVF